MALTTNFHNAKYKPIDTLNFYINENKIKMK